MMYREVLKTPFFDVCSLLKGSSSNKLVAMLVDMANYNTPGLIHECPYTASEVILSIRKYFICNFQEINVRNATIKTSKMYAVFPSGDYKLYFTLNEGKEWIANVNLILNLNSPDKETFG